MNKICFLLLVAFTISAWTNDDKSGQSSTKENLALNDTINSDNYTSNDMIKSNFNGDTLKQFFIKSPFYYTFKDERTIDGTSETHVEGYEDETNYKKYVDLPNSIVINYNLTNRKAASVTFYLNHFKTDNIKLRDCKKLIDFIDFFDPNASKYLQKNFQTIFYNEAANEKLDIYKPI